MSLPTGSWMETVDRTVSLQIRGELEVSLPTGSLTGTVDKRASPASTLWTVWAPTRRGAATGLATGAATGPGGGGGRPGWGASHCQLLRRLGGSLS